MNKNWKLAHRFPNNPLDRIDQVAEPLLRSDRLEKDARSLASIFALFIRPLALGDVRRVAPRIALHLRLRSKQDGRRV